ncbi:hypothetical protein D3C72_1589640 [compost metagenome]
MIPHGNIRFDLAYRPAVREVNAHGMEHPAQRPRKLHEAIDPQGIRDPEGPGAGVHGRRGDHESCRDTERDEFAFRGNIHLHEMLVESNILDDAVVPFMDELEVRDVGEILNGVLHMARHIETARERRREALQVLLRHFPMRRLS